MKIKTLFHGGVVESVKQEDRGGVPVGIVEGYIATWDVDRGDWTGTKDKFIKGAFLDSIARHKASNSRPVRLKDMHGRTIGGFPIDSVKEDARGLFGKGEINLDVQQGREAFALAKQGVMSDFSIGWQLVDHEMKDGIREISKAEIWEGSIVDEPMNPHANITAVKAFDIGNLASMTVRELEDALKSGVTFTNKEAKLFIQYLKSTGVLRDEHDSQRDAVDEKQLLEAIEKTLNIIKE